MTPNAPGRRREAEGPAPSSTVRDRGCRARFPQEATGGAGARPTEPGRLPLFDLARLAGNLEAAYAGMWRHGARPCGSDILPEGAVAVAPARA